MNLLSAQQNKASILEKSKAKFNVVLKLTAHWMQTTSVTVALFFSYVIENTKSEMPSWLVS